ncbi:MAG: RNA 2',3'-cyclic phosphodiesterase [Gammaproteobacteria bacterium]|nr:RNA 2',3'-cyclic phosphodiesterase [Gammaproteobacteria bacterium]NNF48373.1 RNA 2',3'-cyclic phosphodiesterase [Woeseiaceae bacterium]MBT8093594.1 RNA 2',3'-cyclic phosphodiesterase [Gammaproteobacteria bacterium]MBT8104291.1 RNA 2',3'-cyclic phosphodiesterase [Gammaproteobacteria bacterium]NNK24306.1 RNA 2',3'-cyclic phosphodiesterase [Woeseiaceae bacterium]
MDTKRLFFALWPNHRQRDHLRDVINSVAKTVEGRMVDRRNWHVTLVFIGTFPANRIGYLLERAAEVPVAPFRVNFDRLEFWPRPRVAALCASVVPPEMQAVVDGLNGVISALGVRPEERVYRPHITVARNARQFTTERLTHRELTEWSEFQLMESVSGPGGVRYEPLKQ